MPRLLVRRKDCDIACIHGPVPVVVGVITAAVTDILVNLMMSVFLADASTFRTALGCVIRFNFDNFRRIIDSISQIGKRMARILGTL